MSDLISRSALLEAMPKNDEIFSFEVRRVICNAPAVDAEVVRHGRWIEVVTYDQDGDCLEVEYKCSECGRLEGLDDEPYCNCGAKMEQEDN